MCDTFFTSFLSIMYIVYKTHINGSFVFCIVHTDIVYAAEGCLDIPRGDQLSPVKTSWLRLNLFLIGMKKIWLNRGPNSFFKFQPAYQMFIHYHTFVCTSVTFIYIQTCFISNFLDIHVFGASIYILLYLPSDRKNY